MFRAYCCFCEPAPLLLMHGEKPAATSPLMCPYQMSVAYYRRGGVSWAALWTSEGLQRDHERDIVQYGPRSSFADKWIFMLINSDTDMSENCGECGIILTPRPYTRTTVVSSVCGLSLSCERGFFFLYSGVTFDLDTMCTVNATNAHRASAHCILVGKYHPVESPLSHFDIRCILCVYVEYISLIYEPRWNRENEALSWTAIHLLLLNHVWFWEVFRYSTMGDKDKTCTLNGETDVMQQKRRIIPLCYGMWSQKLIDFILKSWFIYYFSNYTSCKFSAI